jgi:hypothetical protein
VKNTHQESLATFLPFFEKSAKKIWPLFLPAAEIFMGPLLCFAAEISASWQHRSWEELLGYSIGQKLARSRIMLTILAAPVTMVLTVLRSRIIFMQLWV